MVVRMRSTRSHTGNRRSHHALKARHFVVCKNCGEQHVPHKMCLACGFYKGRIVIDMQARRTARDAKLQTKKAQQTANQAPATPEEDTTATEENSTENKKD